MTREEAKTNLNMIRVAFGVPVTKEQKELVDETFEMAIQALSQEPCDDAISRDFQVGDEVRIIGSDPIYDDCDVGWVIRNASERVKTMYVMRNDGSADEETKAEWYRTGRHNDMLAEVIKALPSVTQKSGKWIALENRFELGDRVKCSECGQVFVVGDDVSRNFCPNCGAKMESEEQE